MPTGNHKRVGRGTYRLIASGILGYMPSTTRVRTGFASMTDAIDRGRQMNARSIRVIWDTDGTVVWHQAP